MLKSDCVKNFRNMENIFFYFIIIIIVLLQFHSACSEKSCKVRLSSMYRYKIKNSSFVEALLCVLNFKGPVNLEYPKNSKIFLSHRVIPLLLVNSTNLQKTVFIRNKKNHTFPVKLLQVFFKSY